jgi:hypothetical protein
VVRRSALVVASVTALLLALPTAAAAEYRARLVAPGSGVVTGPVEVQVQVSRELIDPEVRGVQVRAVDADRAHPAECVTDCGSRSPVFAFALDPRTGSPFSERALANGTLEVEVVVSRAVGGERSAGRVPLALEVPGSAVGGLSATVTDGGVRVAWSRAPEPDVTGYRVERCSSGCDADDGWDHRIDVAASATAHTERPDPGTHRYRVVTIRPTGSDGSIETVSSPVAADVAPPPQASPSSGSEVRDEGPAPPGDGPDPSATEDVGTGERAVAGAASAGPAGAPDAGDRSRAPDRAGRSPSVELRRSGAAIPDLPLVGELFRDTLDYGSDAATTRTPAPRPGPEDGEVVIAAPVGGSGTFVGRLTDPDRVAVPLAGGLLLTAAGLHLVRWLRLAQG